MRDVVVPVDRDVGRAEPAPVDDARVIELVAADKIAGPPERGNHADVAREPGAEEKHCLGLLEVGELELEPRCTCVSPPSERAARLPKP